jgi:hypothetical protein
VLAGAVAPYARPSSTAPSTTSTSVPPDAASSIAITDIMITWMTRTGP